MKSHLKLVKPDAEYRAVALKRQANCKYRSREHLTPSEIEKLIEAAKTNRYGHRDATMLLMAYRHGLRASELCGLDWSQVDFHGATLHVRRAKNGKRATHPIRGDEMRALRKLQREAPKSSFVFVNERGTPFSPDGFNWLVKRAGQKAGLPFQVHAHMLRHSAGYKLAGDGHDTRAIPKAARCEPLPVLGQGLRLAPRMGRAAATLPPNWTMPPVSQIGWDLSFGWGIAGDENSLRLRRRNQERNAPHPHWQTMKGRVDQRRTARPNICGCAEIVNDCWSGDFAMTIESLPSRLSVAVIGFFLTLAPTVTSLHAAENTRKTTVVSFGLFGGDSVVVRSNTRTGGSATAETLATTLQAEAKKMNGDSDILFLILTSHGSRDGLAVVAGRLAETLKPSSLSEMLARTGVRNKVVIISACFSGVFIPRLADADTLVITAADANHPSFGCEDKAKWTYFGDAFFNTALRRSNNLKDAFLMARSLVSRRELREGFEPSHPQMAGGEKVEPLLVARPSSISGAIEK